MPGDPARAAAAVIILTILVPVVVAALGVWGGILVANRNRKATTDVAATTDTGEERRFLLEKFNELAADMETRWKEAEKRWDECEDKRAADAAVHREEIAEVRKALRDTKRELVQALTDDDDVPPVD